MIKSKPYSNVHYKNMSNEAKAFISIMNSLNVSVNQAGGMGFSLEQLENMTAAELLAILAPNSIKFKYQRDSKVYTNLSRGEKNEYNDDFF